MNKERMARMFGEDYEPPPSFGNVIVLDNMKDCLEVGTVTPIFQGIFSDTTITINNAQK